MNAPVTQSPPAAAPPGPENTETPLVSIIIPCYNQAEYLEESVGSARAQTYGNIEIIVVDDGSDAPASLAVLKTFSAPGTRIIRQENKGRAGVRNTGVRHARGKYILPLDADDRIAPEYVAQAVPLLESDPQLGIVTCNVRFFGSTDKEWRLPECTMETMLKENCIHIASMFRKADWEAVGGFDETLRSIYEDYDFWLSILESGRTARRLPETMLYYRKHDASQTTGLRKRRFSGGMDERREALAHIFAKHTDLYRRHAHIAAARIYTALTLPRPRHMEIKKIRYRAEHALFHLLCRIPGLCRLCVQRLERIKGKLDYIARVEAQEKQ